MAVDRSTYDKMNYSNFHLVIGNLLVLMLYQSANDNLCYLRIEFFTFPGEIICGVGMAGEDAQRKRKRTLKYIHPYQRQIREKYQPIFIAASVMITDTDNDQLNY